MSLVILAEGLANLRFVEDGHTGLLFNPFILCRGILEMSSAQIKEPNVVFIQSGHGTLQVLQALWSSWATALVLLWYRAQRCFLEMGRQPERPFFF
jgi:hypothetical protein